jgi:DNA polymerase-3 subunit epsilon
MMTQPPSQPRQLTITRPLAFLDLETTGKTIGLDRIVEIGVLKAMPDGTEMTFGIRVNPEAPISTEATAIHGIADRDIQGAPTFRQIAPRLAKFLDGCDFAGYSILNFDLPMLQAEFRRVGTPLLVEGRQILDVMSIYVLKEPRDLNAAYRFYCGSEHRGAHSASADARACREVLQGQLRMYADLPNTPVGLSAFINEHSRARTLDSGGWFETRNGSPAFARGKHQGRPIQEVANSDPDYLEWMLSTDPPTDTIRVVRSVLPDFGR